MYNEGEFLKFRLIFSVAVVMYHILDVSGSRYIADFINRFSNIYMGPLSYLQIEEEILLHAKLKMNRSLISRVLDHSCKAGRLCYFWDTQNNIANNCG